MMAEAAQIAVGISGCDFLDINMGCPMPKIANNGDGSALMRDIPLAGRIIRAVADAVSVPVTVKTRLGWDRSCPSAVALAREAEENGAAAITVHGRTKAMLYSGRADWDAIGEVVPALDGPSPIEGRLRKAPLRVPEGYGKCTGFTLFGRRIRSLLYSTDVAVIRNSNADAIFAVYPFTAQPAITQALLTVADII